MNAVYTEAVLMVAIIMLSDYNVISSNVDVSVYKIQLYMITHKRLYDPWVCTIITTLKFMTKRLIDRRKKITDFGKSR